MNRSLLGTSTAQLVLRSASLVPRPLPDFEWPGDEATDPPSPKDAYFRSLLDLPDITICGYYAVAILNENVNNRKTINTTEQKTQQRLTDSRSEGLNRFTKLCGVLPDKFVSVQLAQ